MPNYPIRFRNGQGLEASSGDKTQLGLQRLQNIDLNQKDVILARPGHQELALTTSSDPNEFVPNGDTRAIWYRDEELLLETRNELYSQNKCTANVPPQTAGTATQQEIADYNTEFNQNLDYNDVPIPLSDVDLPGSVNAANVRARLAGRNGQVQEIINYNIIATDNTPTTLTITSTFLGNGITIRFSCPLIVTDYTFIVPKSGNDLHLSLVNQAPVYRLGTHYIHLGDNKFTVNRQTIQVKFDNPGYSWVVNELSDLTVTGTVLNTPSTGHTRFAVDGGFICAPYVVVGGIQFKRTAIESVNISSSQFVSITDINTGWAFDFTEGGSAINSDYILSKGNSNTVYKVFSATLDTFLLPFNNNNNTGQICIYNREFGVEYTDISIAPIFNIQTIGGKTQSRLISAENDKCKVSTNFDIRDINGTLISSIGTNLVSYDQKWFLEIPSSSERALIVTNSDEEYIKIYWWNLGVDYDSVDTIDASIPLGSPEIYRKEFDLKPLLSNTKIGVLLNDVYISSTGPTQYETKWHLIEIVSYQVYNTRNITIADYRNFRAYCYLVNDDITQELFFISRERFSYIIKERRYDSLDVLIVENELFSSSSVTNELFVRQIGTPPRLFISDVYEKGFQSFEIIETYEYDYSIPFLIRIDPPILSLQGGNFFYKDPWTRTYHSVQSIFDYSRDGVNEDKLINTDTAYINFLGCLFTINETEQRGIEVLIRSDHLESQTQVDLDGVQPRIRPLNDNLAFVTYLDSGDNDLLWAEWNIESALSFNVLGNPLSANRVYDIATGYYDDTEADSFAIIAKDDQTAGSVYLYQYITTTKSFANLAVINTGFAGIDSISCQIVPYQGDNWGYIIVTAIYQDDVYVYVRQTHPDKIDTVLYNFSSLAVFNGASSYAHASHCLDPNTGSIQLWNEYQIPDTLDTPDTHIVEFWDIPLNLDPPTEIRPEMRRAAIHSSLEIIHDDQIVGLLSSLGPDFDQRSGYFLFCADTSEVIGRSQFGVSEASDLDAADVPLYRLNRDQKNSLNLKGNRLDVGVRTSLSLDAPTTAKNLTWDLDIEGNQVPTARLVAVSAHGGYPRAYDGQQAFEHDWHELPEISRSLGYDGPDLPAGTYGVALTYEFEDAQGLLHRSRPYFDTVTITSTQNIQVNARPPTWSERDGIVYVLWRTIAGGTTYYREYEYAINNSVDAQALQMTILDTALQKREQLLETPDNLLPSENAAVTDFMAYARGRFWSKDPERQSLARFTNTPIEGLSSQWNQILIIDANDGKDLTAISNFDSKIVFFDRDGVSYTAGDGPDNTGIGLYPVPNIVPSEIGCKNQVTVAKIPHGIVFGSGKGPRLLTRSIQVMDISEPVYRFFELNNQIVKAAAYRQTTGTLHLIDDSQDITFTQTLRYHPGTNRWAQDTGLQSKDIAISATNNELAYLSIFGKILIENDTIFIDGSIPYQSIVRTPWVRQPTQDQVQLKSFQIQDVTIFGRRLNSHDLYLNMYINYDLSTPYKQFYIPVARIDSQDSLGKPYIYKLELGGIECDSALFEITDNSEENQRWLLESIDINWQAIKTNNVASIAKEQLFEEVSEV